MTEYKAIISWERGTQVFLDNRYSRLHQWQLDGIKIPASSSPHVVPLPYSDPNAIDPEEAFVASLSSCHMLWFLSIAVKNKFCVDIYVDEAVGSMAKNELGRLFVAQVILRPKIIFSGDLQPTQQQIISMHEQAHEQCFIANSVKTEVFCEPIFG